MAHAARLILAPVPFVIAWGACAQPASGVALNITAKQGLLDEVTAELRVIDAAEASCAGGIVTPESPPDDAVQRFTLESQGCAGGAKLCAEITLEQDGEEKVFEVIARRGNTVRARGCTTVAVDQDPLDVSITVVPNLPPACCNDGVLQAGEQCDSGMAAAECFGTPADPNTCGAIAPTFVCDCNCWAREIPLSEPGVTPPLGNDVGSKFDLAMAFAGPAGTLANSLRTVFTDTGGDPSGTQPNINVRYLDGNLDIAGLPPVLQQQLRLKNSCDPAIYTAHAGLTRSQGQADIARISDNNLAVVFQDDNATNNPAGSFNIHLVQLNDIGCAEDIITTVNATKANPLQRPAVAGGPPNTALVVWLDGTALKGRVWKSDADGSCNTCVPATDIDIATVSQGSRPRVAGNANGWRVVYVAPGQGADVFMKPVDPNGVVGPQAPVNLDGAGEQTHADVAMHDDGRFAVVWSSNGALMFQRYAADGTAIAGDQDQPLNVDSPAGQDAAIAAGIDAGGFYTAAWLAVDGSIWARYLGTTDRFLINAVNGTFDDFLASHPFGPFVRGAPDVAIGGNGFVAIGWPDTSDVHPGIYVRRFPLPSALVQ